MGIPYSVEIYTERYYFCISGIFRSHALIGNRNILIFFVHVFLFTCDNHRSISQEAEVSITYVSIAITAILSLTMIYRAGQFCSHMSIMQSAQQLSRRQCKTFMIRAMYLANNRQSSTNINGINRIIRDVYTRKLISRSLSSASTDKNSPPDDKGKEKFELADLDDYDDYEEPKTAGQKVIRLHTNILINISFRIRYRGPGYLN